MVRGPGFEPGLTASKAAVLPLDDPRMHEVGNLPIIRRRSSLFVTCLPSAALAEAGTTPQISALAVYLMKTI